jgi:hypothetical protein
VPDELSERNSNKSLLFIVYILTSSSPREHSLLSIYLRMNDLCCGIVIPTAIIR